MARTVDCGPELPPAQVQARTADGAATGLRLLVGGAALQQVDFDTGRIVRLHPQPAVSPNEWFDSFERGSGTLYATASTLPCEIENTRVIAVHGTHTSLVSLAPSSGVIADESRAWALRDPPHVLSPLAGGRTVALPPGFVPVAATRGLVVGNLVSAMDPDEIIAVDTRSGQLKAISGAIGSILAVGDGRVYWTSRCATDAPCRLLSAAARGGSERRFRLPAPPAGSPGRISPDGRHLALVVDHRADGRPRSPALGGDVALVDLRSGRLQVVPGLALSTARPAELRLRAGRLAGRRLRARRGRAAGRLACRVGPSGALAVPRHQPGRTADRRADRLISPTTCTRRAGGWSSWSTRSRPDAAPPRPAWPPSRGAVS